ncbi:MAG TPA: Na+/H+ antiporter NhaA [Longimicrobium sp.]|nr:Na+/H+ antiporter NhaA [Longimicrobium sp.]
MSAPAHSHIVPPPPPTPIERLLSPFGRFAATESAGGLVLIASTAAALIAANSGWAGAYRHLWETPVSFRFGGQGLEYSLHHWINDGLMAVFFFVVGLEIKREVLVGELASARRAALPIAGALGGMVVPALVFAALNAGGAGAAGWGIPMATDIAFAMGVLALVGNRAPAPLKIFLAALAIADDIGAVLVIAVFYTAVIDMRMLALGLGLIVALGVFNKLGARRPYLYVVLGLAVWVCFLKSGVHATVAGVLVAMTIPARTRIDTGEFSERGRRILDAFDQAGPDGENLLTNRGQQAAIIELENTAEAAQAPLQWIEHSLQPWVSFVIIPLFAFANAGVELKGELAQAFTSPVTLGVLLGLLVGKPLGITAFAWLATRLRVAALPAGCSWRALHAVSWLGGIGFTMSLFITGLAFTGEALVTDAKVGIFTASVAAALIGALLLRRQTPSHVGEVPEEEMPVVDGGTGALVR